MNLGLGTLLSVGIVAATVIVLLAIWSIIWKGFALWIAAQEDNKPWFIVLIILNTVGILEIVYIFLFSKRGKKYVQDWKKHRANKKSKKGSHSTQE